MHSLEQIKFMNTDAEIAKRAAKARILNRRLTHVRPKKEKHSNNS